MKNNQQLRVNHKTMLQDSRLHIVQSFYGYLINEDHDIDDLIRVIENTKICDEDANYNVDFLKYFSSLLQGTSPNNYELIQKYMKEGKSFESLDILMQSLLIIAVYELQYLGDYGAKNIIDDYVTISTFFYTEREVGFVNAILDKIAKQLREAEFSE